MFKSFTDSGWFVFNIWLSVLRRAHSFYQKDKSLPGSHGQRTRVLCFGKTYGYNGATGTLIRGVEVLGTAFWHDSGSSRRNSHVDPWRWSLENHVLACFRVFKRLSSNGAVLSVEMNPCRGL
eukprot:9399832-Pyramimonas_sp.AAC.1